MIKNPKFMNKLNEFKNPELIIAVFADKYSTFSIAARTSLNNIQNLIDGDPSEFNLKKNEGIIYQFYNYQHRNMKIFVNKEFGKGAMQMKFCKGKVFGFDLDVDSCLRDLEISTYDSLITEDSNLILSSSSTTRYINAKAKDGPDYCFFCFIFVKLTAVTDFKGSMYILKEGETFNLLPGRKIYDSYIGNKVNYYKIQNNYKSEVTIKIRILLGNPQLDISFVPIGENEHYPLSIDKKNNSMIVYSLPPIKSDLYNTDPELMKLANHEHKNAKNFIINDIRDVYLAVREEKTLSQEHTAKSPSNYTIQFSINDTPDVLEEGTSSFEEMKGSSFKNYTFENSNERRISPILAFTFYSKDALQYLKLRIFFQEGGKKSHQFNQGKIEVFEGKIKAIGDKGISYELSDKKGIYLIEVENRGKGEQRFQVEINSEAISSLPLETNTQFYLQPYSSKYYEILVPSAGYLSLELLECQGSAKVYETKSLTDFTSVFGSKQPNPIQQNDYLKTIRNDKPGAIYLEISSMPNEGYFDLITKFYKSEDDIPFKYYKAGNNGEVTYYSLKKENSINKYQIMFTTLDCNNCAKFNSNIDYYLIASENKEHLIAYEKCGLYVSQHKYFYTSKVYTEKIQNENRKSKVIGSSTISLNNKISKYYVMVKAVITTYQYGKKVETKVYYKVNHIEGFKQSPFKGRNFYLGLSVVFFLLLIGVAGAAYFFYRKYKKLKMNMAYEMNDIQNVASVSGLNLSQSEIELENKGTNRKFKSLMENEDEF